MRKYRTSKYGCEIETVEVERETDKSVWINGQRNAKRTDWFNYWNTFIEAKNHLMIVAEKKINAARFNLECAEAFYENVCKQKPDSNELHKGVRV